MNIPENKMVGQKVETRILWSYGTVTTCYVCIVKKVTELQNLKWWEEWESYKNFK